MSKKRNAIIASVAAVAVLGIGAAVVSNQAGSASENTIVVATEGTYAPFTFHDANNNLTGYDIEVFKAVAKEAGYNVKFKETTWDGIFDGLQAKRWDAIANEVTIRDDRQKLYDLTDPYTVSNYVAITRSDDTKVAKIEDISGLTAAQSATSSFSDLAKKYGAKIETVEGFTQAIALLQLKRVDVTLNDSLAAADYIAKNRDAGVKIAASFGDVSKQGFVFRKGSGLAAKFNAALKKLEDNGTIAAIGKKYFGKDVSK